MIPSACATANAYKCARNPPRCAHQKTRKPLAALTQALRAEKATEPGVGLEAESWQGSRAGRGAKPGLASRSRGRLGGPAASQQKKGEAGRRGGWPRSGTGNRQPIAGAGAKVGRGRGPAAGGPTPRADTGGEGGGRRGRGAKGQGPIPRLGKAGGAPGFGLRFFKYCRAPLNYSHKKRSLALAEAQKWRLMEFHQAVKAPSIAAPWIATQRNSRPWPKPANGNKTEQRSNWPRSGVGEKSVIIIDYQVRQLSDNYWSII